MQSIDEFDIRESFDALDDEKLGRLCLDRFYVLYLGLGYPKLTKDELKLQVRSRQTDEYVTIDTVLKILSQKTRDRSSEISKCFSLVDQESKGYITSQDIARLSEEADGESLSMQEAEAMLSQSQSLRHTGNKLYECDFRKLLAPPSP